MTAKSHYIVGIVCILTVLFSGDWLGAIPPQTDETGYSYIYKDDFSTHKAENDSYDHSIFWPENAFPPAEPYLFYSSRFGDPPPGVVFMGFKGQRAYLNYCFPIRAITDQVLRGTMEFNLKYPTNATVLSAENIMGYMCYSLSPDGVHWTIPVPLKPGHQTIEIGSHQGTCYVSLSGHCAMIDNLLVRLNAPQPQVLRVPEDYPTIQEGIDAALPGQIVEVAPGNYSGKGNQDLDFRGKAITVRSARGPQVTIIDCLSPLTVIESHRGFYFHQAERHDSILQGFTIRGGRVYGFEIPPDNMRWNLDPAHPIGGGIYCEFASPTIENCIFEDCGTEVGGGIGCVGARPVIKRCKFIKCRAGGFSPCESGGRGGGIGLIRFSAAQIINCEIVDNQGYWNSFGGGIYSRRSRAKVIRCNIIRNGAPGGMEGGGVYCGPGSDMVLENCIISDNTANAGAGVYSVRLQQYANSLTDSPECCFCDLLIKNCTIAHNRLQYPMPIFPGAGIHSIGTDILVKNSIIWYNKPTQIVIYKPTGKCPVIFSDIQSGYPIALDKFPEPCDITFRETYNWEGYPNPADLHCITCPGNIDKDPLFAKPELPHPDYHLKSRFGRYVPGPGIDATGIWPGYWVRDKVHSPAIDAGDPRDPVGGELPPNGHRINMGAYGGTWQASKSKGRRYFADINGDGVVDLWDFVIFAQQWMKEDPWR
ncbi:MAG: hypothetical protein AMJ79_10935 [Phycisphaerae bacterium SM23_30]|nr:MAG: hypothetical protein AMJ79_10935 [Phycisphaerae bacterium SM23_30]